MRFVSLAMVLVIFSGCANVPNNMTMSSSGATVQSVAAQEIGEPASKGLTGNAALEFLNAKKATMLARINPERAEARLSTATSEMRGLKTQSNYVAGGTLAVGGIIAAAANLSVAGGIITAILGGVGLYTENQRNDQGRVDLISACRTVSKAGSAVVDRYSDKWEIVFRQYNSSVVPDNKIEQFNVDTEATNDKVSDLIGTCV